MSTVNPFQPAVKAQLKARVALDGPTGSGKTWTALSMARTLAGPEGKIAVVDTERGKAKLYAHIFSFDHLQFDAPYDVHRLLDNLRAAEANGYGVGVIDSWSHFWEGEGGVLDEVDAAASRFQGNSFAGWKHGTPLQRHMIDTILGLDMHVIVCMRSKMEYIMETDSKGKQVPRKVGMAPVQRAGVEYEFDVIGDLDLDHRITISKSRCELLADKVIQPHRESEAAQTFLDWLNDGTPPPPRADTDAVSAHFDRVKQSPAGVRAAMTEWWKARGYEKDRLTVPELDGLNEHLADLLIDASIESGEPAGEVGGEQAAEQTEAEQSSSPAPEAGDVDSLPLGAESASSGTNGKRATART